MNKIGNFGLRTKIIALVLFSLFIVGAGSLYSLFQMGSTFKNDSLLKIENAAKTFADALAAQFFERYGDVQAFAANPNIQNLDLNKIPDTLDEYVTLYGLYDLILVVDRNGKLVSTNTKSVEGNPVDRKALENVDYAKTPWFQNVMAGKTTDDKERGLLGTYFEEMNLDSLKEVAFGKSSYGTSFSSAVKNKSGEIIGVITNRTSGKWIEYDAINLFEVLKELGLNSLAATVINKENKVLFEHDPARYTKGENKIFYNNEEMLKLDLSDQPAVIESKTNKHGNIISKDRLADGNEVVGFAVINSSKWPREVPWTVLVRADEAEVLASVTSTNQIFYAIFLACLIVSLTLTVFMGSSIARAIDGQIQILMKNSPELSRASGEIASQSTELSESSTEQAAALQETVSAVDEINAMVQRNAESAENSKTVSAESKQKAQAGKETVNQMLNAMNDISQSNDEISNQMTENTQQLTEINRLISDINNKTKVINEIVFQTKLLSFNASVEAARAGEAGKGFSVVAEEVGNLAQMSGAASKEISELLDQSTRKVNAIVEESKKRVDVVVNSSRQKVQAGTLVVQECNRALEEIIVNVTRVDAMVTEISAASREQSQGIREISKAMNQMEQATQQNQSVAQASSVAVEELSTRAKDLNQVVADLVLLVKGEEVDAYQSQRQSTPAVSNVVPLKRSTPGSRGPAASTKAAAGSVAATGSFPIAKNTHQQNETGLSTASGEYVPSANDPGFGDD